MGICKKDIASTEEGRLNYGLSRSAREKVFLIGDSIREGYCPYVEEFLDGTFEVAYPNENCRNTQYVLTSLRGWTTMFDDVDKVKVVCFNCGHWDIAHWNRESESLTTETDYCRNLKRIIQRLKKSFAYAEIVFFTTTPVNESLLSTMANPRTNEEIERYNQLAIKVAKEEGVCVGDMYEVVSRFGEECYKDYAHLKDEYCERLGEYVASVIKSCIQ